MSFTRRLFNIARAELKGAVRGLRSDHPRHAGPLDDWTEELKRSSERSQARGDAHKKPELVLEEDQVLIARYYANLELPIGAPVAEVKASYRRLVRRYHPDHHQHDADSAKAATELSRQLRVAYEGLLAHLEGKPLPRK